MDADLGPILPRLRELTDKFYVEAGCPSANLSDYWRWSSSNLLDNTERGVLAEFLVANALGLTDKPRVEWGSHDLKTPAGTKIKVKSVPAVLASKEAFYDRIRYRSN